MALTSFKAKEIVVFVDDGPEWTNHSVPFVVAKDFDLSDLHLAGIEFKPVSTLADRLAVAGFGAPLAVRYVDELDCREELADYFWTRAPLAPAGTQCVACESCHTKVFHSENKKEEHVTLCDDDAFARLFSVWPCGCGG